MPHISRQEARLRGEGRAPHARRLGTTGVTFMGGGAGVWAGIMVSRVCAVAFYARSRPLCRNLRTFLPFSCTNFPSVYFWGLFNHVFCIVFRLVIFFLLKALLSFLNTY